MDGISLQTGIRWLRSLASFHSARAQPDHGHQECRPALSSDLPAPFAPAPQRLLRQTVDGLSHSFSAVSPEHVLPVLVEETENYTIIIAHEEALYEGSMLGVFYQLVARKTSASSQCWAGSCAPEASSEGAVTRTALLKDGISGQVVTCRECAEVGAG